MKFKHLIEMEELYNKDFNIQVSNDMILLSFNNNYVYVSVAVDKDWSEPIHLTRDKYQIIEVENNELDDHIILRAIFL